MKRQQPIAAAVSNDATVQVNKKFTFISTSNVDSFRFTSIEITGSMWEKCEHVVTGSGNIFDTTYHETFQAGETWTNPTHIDPMKSTDINSNETT